MEGPAKDIFKLSRLFVGDDYFHIVIKLLELEEF